MADIATIMDELLKSKGVSGAKMCSDLGMSRSFMTELRKGRAKSITMETAEKVASYLGVTVDYLLGKEEMPTVTGEQKETPDQLVLTGVDKELYELLIQIPEEQKKLFLEMGRAFVNNLNKG